MVEFADISAVLKDQSEIEDDCCGSCVWFQRKDSTCHRYPPSLAPGNNTILAPKIISLWPSVKKEDWCGEFENGESEDFSS